MAVFILVVIIMLPKILMSNEGLDGKIFFIVWSIVVIWVVTFILRMPKSIEYDPVSKKMVFISIFNRKEIKASSVLMVKSTLFTNGYIKIFHDSGKIIMINNIDGFHELINEIKTVNPNIDTKGF